MLVHVVGTWRDVWALMWGFRVYIGFRAQVHLYLAVKASWFVVCDSRWVQHLHVSSTYLNEIASIDHALVGFAHYLPACVLTCRHLAASSTHLRTCSCHAVAVPFWQRGRVWRVWTTEGRVAEVALLSAVPGYGLGFRVSGGFNSCSIEKSSFAQHVLIAIERLWRGVYVDWFWFHYTWCCWRCLSAAWELLSQRLQYPLIK